MADTKTLLIVGAVGIGGYLLWKSQQQPTLTALQQQQMLQQQQPGQAWGAVIGGLVSGIGSLFGSKPKIVSVTGTQVVPGSAGAGSQYASGTSINWTPPDAGTPAATLKGYYGSLGAYGDGGSLGGCHSLGCAKYGSLS